MLLHTPEVSLRAKDYTMSKQAAVYLMTNRTDGTLYTGVTNDLIQRVWQHKNGITGGFCSKYNITLLVYFELYEDMYAAITREKQIKAGSRKAKIKLIDRMNPGWKDLYPDILP
jgi:putative endonuclease